MLDTIKNYIDPPEDKFHIFFLHIPKCAGTSVNRSIIGLYKPWRKGQANKVFHLDENAARNAEEVLEIDQRQLRNSLLAYALSCENSKLVIGHFLFSEKVLEEYKDKWNFVTVLRHPVDRWLSHYYYNLNRPHKYEINAAIHEFVETERARKLGALTVSLFSEGMNGSARHIDAAISRAKNNLKQFSIVGCSEKMAEFESEFYAKFGRKLNVPRLNIGGKRHLEKDIDKKTWNRIWSLCQPDLELYREFFKDVDDPVLS